MKLERITCPNCKTSFIRESWVDSLIVLDINEDHCSECGKKFPINSQTRQILSREKHPELYNLFWDKVYGKRPTESSNDNKECTIEEIDALDTSDLEVGYNPDSYNRQAIIFPTADEIPEDRQGFEAPKAKKKFRTPLLIALGVVGVALLCLIIKILL